MLVEWRELAAADPGPEGDPERPNAAAPIEAVAGDRIAKVLKRMLGDGARIEAPYGRFSLVHQRCGSLVFIAGGVGITPIVSMLRYLKETDDLRPVLLLYGNKTERDILFREELDALPDHVETVHILSEPADDWQGPRGYVTRDVLETYAAARLSDSQTHVFLCGPAAMMDNVMRDLKAMGVPDSRVHHEQFTL